MFGSIEKSKGLLFCTHDLDQSLRNTVQAMRQEVEGLDANRLLNTAPQDLTQYFAEKHSVEPITLRREDWYADHKEVQVDVRYDSMRWIDDKSRPALVPGERIEVRVPFDGEPELFYSSPNTMTSNPPRAVVEKNELVLRYESPSDAPRDVRPLVDKALSDIEQYLGWQRGMIETHNSSLVQAAEQAIEQRRERLLAQSQRASTLGIPIRRRDDAPRTYAVPTARRKAAPTFMEVVAEPPSSRETTDPPCSAAWDLSS